MKTILKHIILKLIELIERYEYRNYDLDENNPDKKILDTVEISEKVKSDKGFVNASSIHKTQPYRVYRVELQNGYFIEGADNHIVFTQNLSEIFIKDLQPGETLFTDLGPSRVKSITKTPYKVSMFDMTIDTPEHRYFTNGILSHNTVIAGIFLTWYLLFHSDKNILLGANKGATAVEILDKIKTIIENLPFWLKPGIRSYKAYSISTDANSRILATTTTEKAAIGFTIHLLYLDEFAHVRQNIQRKFFDNIYPVISASKNSKMIITSTPNGYELFQEIYQNSVEEKNEFKNMSIPWWDIPGRDDEWARKEIANIGEDAFNEQFACQFQRSDLLLLSAKQLKKIKQDRKGFIHYNFNILDKYFVNYKNLLFREDYDIENIKNHHLVFSIDLAEGMGRDYTVMHIFKVSPKSEHGFPINQSDVFQLDKHFYLDQIGTFRDNTVSIEEFTKLCYNLFFSNKIVESEKINVVLEWNTYGSFFIEKLKNIYGGDNFEENIFLKTFHRKGAKHRNIGVRQDAELKPKNCVEFKTHIDKNDVLLHDKWTLEEFQHFTRNKKGSYAASTGHDDSVMAAINIVSFLNEQFSVDFIVEAFENLAPEEKLEIDKLMNGVNSLDESTDFLIEDLTNIDTSGNIKGEWF